MAANQNVVDELVVTLTLDAAQYKKADKVIVQLVDKTEKTMQAADAKKKKRDIEQKKRNQETLKSVKELGLGIRSLALTVGSLIGIGSAAGIVGAVVALAGMETNLRRAAVSTGLSNRELQAWGSTARRLGADAQAGASAIADLAREQKQFNLTGNAPTLQAFARMGVRVGANTPIVDILAQAQQMYRQSTPAQRQQIEGTLAAQGVSADLIVAIKSEKDAREEFARSYQESAEENRKALDAVTDGLTALSNAATSVANSIATVLQPYIEQFSQFVSSAAQAVSGFVDQVMAAGGGMTGFMKVLDAESPALAETLRELGSGLKVLAQTVDIVAYGFQSLYQGVRQLFNWLDTKFGALTGGSSHQLRDALGTVGAAVKWAWGNLANEAEQRGPLHVAGRGGAQLTPSAAARIAGSTGASPGATPTAQDFMARLISRYGFSVDQAAAITANAQSESGLRAGAFNPAGGGTGARGLFQWRGPRSAAFKQRYGVLPDQASIEQQLDFLMQDPYERKLLMKSLSGPGGAQDLGANVSRVFEAHGNVAEDLRRGQNAGQLASSYGGPTGAGIGQQINIQSVQVQANSPQEFVGGITRIASPQNYNSAVR